MAFDGSFLEWEAVRADNKAKAERDARALSVAASEKASAARAAAQKASNAAQKSAQKHDGKTPDSKKSGGQKSGNQKPMSDGDVRKATRQAEKALADAELRVNTLEEKIAALTRSLEDSTLYDTPDGVSKAQKLGQQLDTARESLDEAMHEWGVAAEQKQTIGKG